MTREVTAIADKRVQGIDLLRGFCIIAVVLLHMNIRIPLSSLTGPAVGKVVFQSGYYGVRVFFVISGFLIASWSIKRWGALKNIDLWQFYLMRFARIVPCLLGLLALLSVLDLAGVPRFTIAGVRQFPGYAPHPSLGHALFAALTFHVNWLEARTAYLPAAWDVLWSLSVEEAFYVFFPLACALLRKQILLIALLSGFIVVGPFARNVFTHNPIWSEYGYLACMDGIAIGCLAALVAANIRFGARANLALRVSGICLSVFIVIFRGTVGRIGLYKAGIAETVLEIGIALLIIGLQQQFEGNLAQGRATTAFLGGSRFSSLPLAAAKFPGAVLRWFGRNSYEVYLTHVLVMWPMAGLFQYFHQPLSVAPLWCLAYTVLSGALGNIVARFYSEPLNRALRTRLLTGVARAVPLQAPLQQEAQ